MNRPSFETSSGLAAPSFDMDRRYQQRRRQRRAASDGRLRRAAAPAIMTGGHPKRRECFAAGELVFLARRARLAGKA